MDDIVQFELQNVATLRHGLCSLIKYKSNVSADNERIRLYFNFTDLKRDTPKSVNVFLSSPNNWYGMILDDWLEMHPPMFEIPVVSKQDSRWIAKVSQTDYYYLSGTKDFEQCFMDQIDKYSHCPTKCFPVLFNFLPNYSPCNTSEEFNCMWNLILGYRKLRYNCLHPKEDIQYKANFYPSFHTRNNRTEFYFMFYFDRATKEVKEEVWIVTTGHFIGSVGGTLGLSLGFSCFTYLSGIIDKFLP